MVDCACDAISVRGIGVGTGFVGPGFDVAAVDCWAPAVFPLRTQQNEINKPIRNTRRIQAKSELFWGSWVTKIRHREVSFCTVSGKFNNDFQRSGAIGKRSTC